MYIGRRGRRRPVAHGRASRAEDTGNIVVRIVLRERSIGRATIS